MWLTAKWQCPPLLLSLKFRGYNSQSLQSSSSLCVFVPVLVLGLAVNCMYGCNCKQMIQDVVWHVYLIFCNRVWAFGSVKVLKSLSSNFTLSDYFRTSAALWYCHPQVALQVNLRTTISTLWLAEQWSLDMSCHLIQRDFFSLNCTEHNCLRNNVNLMK